MFKLFSSNKKESAVNRRYQRFSCSIVASMAVPVKNLALEGLVTEVSQGGLIFRGASDYILNRNGQEVTVEFAGVLLQGSVVATRITGYGVQFAMPISLEMVQEITQKFGLQAGRMAA
jgi:hypothetical protein